MDPNGAMILSCRSLEAAYWRIRTIQSIYFFTNFAQVLADIRGFGCNYNVVYFNGDIGRNGTPRRLLLNSGDTVHVFINGIATLTQGVQVFNGYTGTSTNALFAGLPLGKSAEMNLWADQIVGEVTPHISNPQRIFISGHSAGGYVARLVAKGLRAAFPSAIQVAVTTFGTPKFGLGEHVPSGIDQHHWFNSDDPVPTIPPRPNGSLALFALLAPYQILRFTYFVQPTDGTQIGVGGELMPGSEPQGLPDPEWISAAAWLFNLTTQTDTPHNVPSYVERLNRRLQASGLYEAPPGGAPRQRQNPEIGVQAAQQIQDQAIQTVFNSDRAVGNTTPTLPVQQVFSVVRMGRAYAVAFGPSIIAVAPHKKRAHGLARVGNDFLRRLQVEGQVDAGAMAEQWVSYLEMASGGDPQFVPPMNTVD